MNSMSTPTPTSPQTTTLTPALATVLQNASNDAQLAPSEWDEFVKLVNKTTAFVGGWPLEALTEELEARGWKGMKKGEVLRYWRVLNPAPPPGNHGGTGSHRYSFKDQLEDDFEIPRVDLISPIKEKLATFSEKLDNVLYLTSFNKDKRGHTTDADWYTQNGTKIIPAWFPAYKKTHTRIFTKKLISAVTDKEKNQIQPRWSDHIIPAINNNLKLEVTLVDLFKIKSVGTRRPDVTGYLRNKPKNEFYLVVLGDIKGGRVNDSFTAQEKGKLAGFLNRAIVETKRTMACGFLTDGRIIQFFRFVDGKLEETTVHLLAHDGENLLLGLLDCDTRLNGVQIGELSTPTGEVLISSQLGTGAHSIVWTGEYDSKEVVVKKFMSQHELLEREVGILKAIASVENVIKLESDATSDPMALLLSPVGIHFVGAPESGDTSTVFRWCHFECLINVLQAVHALGIVHGDVKPSNFFQYKTNQHKLFVNDWSSARWLTETSTKFSGTRLYAPKDYLQAAPEPYPPQPWHDLEAAVKSLYVVMHSAIFYSQFSKEEQCKDRARILAFWESALQLPHWQALLTAAREVRYADMITTAKTVVQNEVFMYKK